MIDTWRLPAALLLMLGLGTGCGAAKSALGVLSPKPPQVTVVNNIEVRPAAVPVIAAPAPAVVEMPRSHHRRRDQLRAVASGAVAGALVGTAIGYVVDGAEGAGKGAALGAGAGAVGGAVAHEAR